jgi:hypothetical protein
MLVPGRTRGVYSLYYVDSIEPEPENGRTFGLYTCQNPAVNKQQASLGGRYKFRYTCIH